MGFFSPPFLKGGQGGLGKSLIIRPNHPLKKGDLKPSASKYGLFYTVQFKDRDTIGRDAGEPGTVGGAKG